MTMSRVPDIREADLQAVLDLPAIKSLLDDFYALTDIGMAIIDLKGNVVLETGWQDICTRFHRIHPQTAKRCAESKQFPEGQLREGQNVLQKCRNNMWEVITPLYVDGQHLANLVLGQFFFDDETFNEQIFTAQAEAYGFDPEAYLDALHKVPVWSREKVNRAMGFYTKFAQLISGLAYRGARMEKLVAEQNQVQEALKDSERQLANIIDFLPDATFVVNTQGRVIS